MDQSINIDVIPGPREVIAATLKGTVGNLEGARDSLAPGSRAFAQVQLALAGLRGVILGLEQWEARKQAYLIRSTLEYCRIQEEAREQTRQAAEAGNSLAQPVSPILE